MIDYLTVSLDLREGCVYGYELFVQPNYRRAGASVAMIAERRRLLHEAGYHTGYSVAMPENQGAMGFQRAVGRIRLGTIHVMWFAGRRRAWVADQRSGDAPPPPGVI